MRHPASLLTRLSASPPQPLYLAIMSLLLLIATLTGAAPVVAAVDATEKPPASYRLGIFPYMAPRQTVEFFGPVAASMERALGHPVKLESTPTFSDFTEAMSRHTFDIALIQPFNYPEFVEQYGYLPLAQMSVPLVTQIFVRTDSRYQTLDDLRGTTIAMPPAEAAIARMTLRALHDNKLIPGRDVEVRNFNSHDSCIQQVWLGAASACGTAQPPVSVFEKRMQASLRPIHATPPIPPVLYVVHPRVPAAQRAILQALIVGWSQTEEGRAIIKSLNVPGYVAARPAEYAMMRNYDPTASVPPVKSAANPELVLGVFPYLAPRPLAQNISPILPALRKAAGMPMHLRTAASFAKFSAGVTAGSYDVILVQPFEYLHATQSGYLPLAGMKDRLQGSFYVRAQSRFQKLADFRKQIIATPPPDSAQAYLARKALTTAGLKPGRDVTMDYRPTHDACLRAVQQGKAAACVSTTTAAKSISAELTRNLRAIGRTDTVPGQLFMAHQRLPATLRGQLQAEIVSWKDTPEGRAILHALGRGDFVPVNPAEYEKLPHLDVPN